MSARNLHPYLATESQVQAAILQALGIYQNFGIVNSFWRSHAAHVPVSGDPDKRLRHLRCNFKGCPDILGVMADGRLLAIECKRDARAPVTKDQRETLDKWGQAGAVAFVAWSVDQVHARMEQWGRERSEVGNHEREIVAKSLEQLDLFEAARVVRNLESHLKAREAARRAASEAAGDGRVSR